MGKIIEIKNLTFSYGDKTILNDLSLDIPESTIYTVLGKTGSGKSTFARILVGLEDVHEYIKIHDLYLNPKNIGEIRKNTGILFENPDKAFVTDNVFEELSFSLEDTEYAKEKIEKEVNAILEKLSIRHLLSRNPHQLSAGEKQLVALASALIARPKLLILDEALSMIDRETKKNVWKLLKEYQKKEKATILHFTDYSEDVLEGTAIFILSEGKIAFQGDIQSVLQSEKLFTSNQLELPFLADLSNKLRYYNTISSVETNLNKLVDNIWK